MKHLLALLTIVSLSLASCNQEDDLFVAPACDQVSYTFINDLGIDIDGIIIDNYDRLPLADGATSITYCIEGIYGFLPTDPWINFELDINGDIVCSAAMLNWCGTGATSDNSGTYELTLTDIAVGDAFPSQCSSYAIYTSLKQ